MKNLEEARQLARLMVAIGRLSKRRVVALLSDMNQPLGRAVGNSLELREAIETLKGKGPEDLREHCLVVAAHMLRVGEKAQDIAAGRRMAEQALVEGRGLAQLKKLVKNQGGDPAYIDNPGLFPAAPVIGDVFSPEDGYIGAMDALTIGECSVEMGAGRSRKEDTIDHRVGIIVHHKVGDRVKAGEVLFTLHARDEHSFEQAQRKCLSACRWQQDPCEPLPLFYEMIE